MEPSGGGETEAEVEKVMSSRTGSVLGKRTILKSDHFPGCQNVSITPHIDGAPNYRQAGSLHVYGVAMPTINGIVNVLNYIGAEKKGKETQFLWHNLREEPVVYVNGRPFVLRDIEKPFNNVEYTGINRERIEEMEVRLKEDVYHEASRYGNKILVTDELPNGKMVDLWETLNLDSVKTPLEVYQELQREGYLVDYERVPITDERAPEEQDFDTLMKKISQVDLETAVLFNCQMGRGRTTTGMVIAVLAYLNRMDASGIPRTSSIGRVNNSGDASDHVLNSEEAILRGEYTVIRSLVRVLEGGLEGKKQVDKVIDMCDAMQNLREAIAGQRNKILKQADELKREASLSMFVKYVERYYMLICFAVYIHSVAVTNEKCSFVEWMKARPELYSILRRLLKRNPMGALGLSNVKPSPGNVTESTSGHPQEEVVVATRNGAVLGPQTILKSDHFLGCHSASLPERIEGAPNFREISGFPVYGVANPTVDGIQAVIQHICKGRGEKPILWHNMREEPVIYINGMPFVLREMERPFKNMLEYTGIDCERLERMEDRLKEDILREAERYGGAIMVTHENEYHEIFNAWEKISKDSVQTSLEVYKRLESNGLPIKYARVPITDGRAPETSDFDSIALNIASSPLDTAFVFNCQMGHGRTTTGTVIGCLLHLRLNYGRPITLPPDEVVNHNEAKSSHEDDDDLLPLREITRFFDNGVHSRKVLDAVIDKCSALMNIRRSVLQYRKITNQQQDDPGELRHTLNRAAEYLEIYLKLIAFSSYLGSKEFDGFCGQGGNKVSFKTWTHQRAELQTIKWNIRLRPGRFFNVSDGTKVYESSEGDATMEAAVRSRNGSVLGKGSILKMYNFTGKKISAGMTVPDIFQVNGYPVHCIAAPTLASAREYLLHLGTKDAQKVVVIDIREEAAAYISGTLFSLAELDQPFEALKHVGITGMQAEHMEARLKEDILSELNKSNGQMLLHREESSITDQKSVLGYWKAISPDDVVTPAEMYTGLKAEGHNIDYRRIPLSREREALASDIDAIQSCVDDSVNSYLFISHSGTGAVAYAMAIACLRINSKRRSNEQTEVTHFTSTLRGENDSSHGSDDAALKQGEYRDILSLLRVLPQGTQSKGEVDMIIERCGAAGHLRDDILNYKKASESCSPDEGDGRSYLLDMGIKALRRYFYLITYRSYLFSASPEVTKFSSWMEDRPELGHLCWHLKLN